MISLAAGAGELAVFERAVVSRHGVQIRLEEFHAGLAIPWKSFRCRARARPRDIELG